MVAAQIFGRLLEAQVIADDLRAAMEILAAPNPALPSVDDPRAATKLALPHDSRALLQEQE